MGIAVGLYVDSRRISEAQWQTLYAETLQLLAAWPDRPIRLSWCEIAGERVAAYSLQVEDESGWRISGLARSRTHFESFDLPRKLAAYGRGGARVSKSDRDILRGLAAFSDEQTPEPHDSGYRYLFGGKTQGLPYHSLIVAVATLIENRLPGAAVATGEIDLDDARVACGELERVFGQPFELPVLMDEARMRARVSNAEVTRAREHIYCTPASPIQREILERLLATPSIRASKEIREVAPGCTDVATLSTHTLACMDAFGAQLRRVSRQAQPAEKRASAGLSRAEVFRQIVSLAQAKKLILTVLAWREIEDEEEPALAFLHDVCQLDLSGADVHEMAVAAFESRAVRQRIMRAWAARP